MKIIIIITLVFFSYFAFGDEQVLADSVSSCVDSVSGAPCVSQTVGGLSNTSLNWLYVSILLFALLLAVITIALRKVAIFRRQHEALEAEQHQLVEQYQVKLKARENFASLGQMVAGVSHEVKTPIGIGVTAASHLQNKTAELQSQYESGAMTQESLEKYMANTAEAADILVANLMRSAELVDSFKRVSVDQSSQIKKEFDLGSYVETLLLSLKPAVKEHGCKIDLHLRTKIITRSYPGAVAQVVTNLVMNALEHGCNGDDAGKIDIVLEKDANDQIKITLSDNGLGISRDIKPQIFEQFFTTDRAGGGSGLGLSIVHSLVTETLGGTIDCKTAAPEGAKFVITLPMSI